MCVRAGGDHIGEGDLEDAAQHVQPGEGVDARIAEAEEIERAALVETDGLRLHVDHLEALHGTPIVDLKPVLGDIAER